MKGLFIPGITAEMFRGGCLESIEALMAEGEIYDIECDPSAQRWIPCSERLPFAEYGESNNVLATCGHRDGENTSIRWIKTLYFNGGNWCFPTGETYEEKVYAWMPLPEPWRGEQDG